MKLVLGQTTEAVVAMVTEEVAAGLVEEDNEDTKIVWSASVWLRDRGKFSAPDLFLVACI